MRLPRVLKPLSGNKSPIFHTHRVVSNEIVNNRSSETLEKQMVLKNPSFYFKIILKNFFLTLTPFKQPVCCLNMRLSDADFAS